MSLLLRTSELVVIPLNQRFCLLGGGGGSESARDEGMASAVGPGNEDAMIMLVSEGPVLFLFERLVSAGGRPDEDCWSGPSDEIAATGGTTGALPLDTVDAGVDGITNNEEARLRTVSGAAARVVAAEAAGRDSLSAGLVGEDMGSAGGNGCEERFD